jgi:SAM-dependent methyltransferase
MDEISPIDLPLLQAFRSLLPANGSLLATPCARLRELRWLADAGFSLEAFDADGVAVERARAELPAAIRLRQADARLITLPRDSFDGIWCHGLVPHLRASECQRALQTFFAALRPRGALLITLLTTDQPAAPDPAAGPPHRYRPDDFASLVRQCGFTLLRQGRNEREPAWLALLARRI